MSKVVANVIAHKNKDGGDLFLHDSYIKSNIAGNVVYPGAVLQVKDAVVGPTSQAISSATPTLITGLSVTITPFRSNSLILVQGKISTNASWVSSFAVYKDGAATVSTAGFTNLSNPNMQLTVYPGYDLTGTMHAIPIAHFEIAGNTNQRTYAIYGNSEYNGSTRVLTINNRASADMASFSHMVVMEIAQ